MQPFGGGVHGIQLPWEMGFAGLVLGPRRGAQPSEVVWPMDPIRIPRLEWVGPVPPPVVHVFPPAPPAAVAPATPRGPPGGVHATRRRPPPTAALSGMPREEVDMLQRQAALRKWRIIVVAAGERCAVGRQMMEAADGDERASILEDVFRPKETATLQKRAGSVLLYLKWGTSLDVALHYLLPFTEAVVYRYVAALYNDEAPATRSSSFMEAAVFTKALLIFDGNLELLSSSRIRGAIEGSFDRKSLLVQRDPLPYRLVAALEEWVVSGLEDDHATIIAGFVLWCVHTRQRVGDALRVTQEPTLDPPGSGALAAFIETVAGKTKTGHLKRRRRRALPLVGCADGVSAIPWAAAWLDRRAAADLSAEADGTMQRAPTGKHDWAIRPMTTEEVGHWVRDFAAAHCPPPVGSAPGNLGSHSLKATILSWAAKAGMEEPHRRILGCHAKSGEKSVAEYARDEMAEPLRQTRLLFGWMRDGEFSPDADRSGRWTLGRTGPQWFPTTPATVTAPSFRRFQELPTAPVEQDDERAEETSSSDTDASSDKTESDESEEPSKELVAVAAQERATAQGDPAVFPGRRLPSAGLYQHDPDEALNTRPRLTLHCGHPLLEDRLRCARLIEVPNQGVRVYQRLEMWPAVFSSECSTCFGGEYA